MQINETDHKYVYRLQKDIFNYLKISEEDLLEAQTYQEYITIGKIQRYFTQGFLLCFSYEQCKYILPKFMYSTFHNYFNYSEIYPTEKITNFVEKNKDIHELIAERVLLNNLLY